MKRRALLVFAVSAAVLTGCATEPPPVSPQVQAYYDSHKDLKSAVDPKPKAITVAAIGDSVTEGNSPDFNNGKLGTLSWPSALPDGEQFVGGWAKKGSTTQVMLDNVKPTTADVLVIIAGTNDLGKLPFATSAANIQSIVQKSGVKRVIVSSIPPRDADPASAVDYNAQLEPFVKAQGWEFVDAMAGVRTADNQYNPGMTIDGTHPTEPAVKLIRAAIAAKIKP